MNSRKFRRNLLLTVFFGLMLSAIPMLILFFALAKLEGWQNAFDSLIGQYTIGGISSNPWREFLPVYLGFWFGHIISFVLTLVSAK